MSGTLAIPWSGATITTFVSVSDDGVPRSATRSQAHLRAGERFLSLFRWTTYGYPVLWLVGVGGFYWVIVGLAGVAYLLSRRRVATIAAPAIAVIAALLLSLPVGVVAFGFDPSRVASFFGNVLVWVALIALLTLAEDRPIADTVSRAVLVIGICQALLTGAAEALHPRQLPLPLLAGLAHLMPSGPAAFDTNVLYVQDWLGQVAFRSAGIMAQPTWGGVFGALTCIVAVAVIVRRRGRWRWVALVAAPCGLYSVVLSLSRSTELCLAAGALVGLLVAIRRRSRAAFAVLSTVGALLAVVIGIGYASQFARLAININDARQGSLTSRSAIYAQTWKLFRQLPFPALGYGIKPKDTALVASVATHSSYLGMLFRGGVLGTLALLLVFVVVLIRAVRAGDGFAAWIAALTTVWCVLEDFDPGHLLPLGLALAVAWTGASPRGSPHSPAHPATRAAGSRVTSQGRH